MIKKRVDELIPYAYEVLKSVNICEEDKDNPGKWVVDPTYTAYISSFGAAVTMGSLISAVAFFAASPEENKKRTSADRGKIGKALLEVLKRKYPNIQEKSLFEYVKNHGQTNQEKEMILDAAVAIKLALNLYPKKPKKRGDRK